jgi:single-stranded-DNA-specific exonuclease
MKWILKTADPEQADRLTPVLRAECRIDVAWAPTLARLLVMRGICDGESASRFLNPSVSQLHSPYLMRGMAQAVERLDAAIERKEPILIYGDYDVDGTTAIVILKTAIELCGGTADSHVPHRIRDGYDMRDDVIERAAAEGIKLIVSVDMGIRAFAPAATAQRLGVDLIVTDHHLPGPDGVPSALAVVNPNQAGCEYPCKALCGAGVAFKLAQGLIERRRPSDAARLLLSFMKVAAIATVADAVPLTGENRVFAKLGLDGLRKAVNPGLKALLEVAQLSGRSLTASEVGFRIGPRINAAGRMDVASDVIELFSVKDESRARELAHKLDQLNTERQEEERRILEAIHTRIEGEPALRDAFCMVIDGDGWHRGVIGITATRIVERYGRPALVLSRLGETAHGSGRSIAPFHLLDALESCSALFSRFGGHSHAVGFSLPASNVTELRDRLDAYARSKLSLPDFEPSLRYDADLELQQVTPKFFQLLKQLEPFGVGNPEPVFAAHHVLLTAPPRVVKEKHVRFRVSTGNATASNMSDAAIAATPRGDSDSSTMRRKDREKANDGWRKSISFNAMGWRMAERLQPQPLIAGDCLDIAFTLDQNEHPEFGGLELSLRDFKSRVAAAAV